MKHINETKRKTKTVTHKGNNGGKEQTQKGNKEKDQVQQRKEKIMLKTSSF